MINIKCKKMNIVDMLTKYVDNLIKTKKSVYFMKLMRYSNKVKQAQK